MEKQREEVLKWFVQFANMNLEEIKPGDKAKLLVESEEYLFPNQEKADFEEASKKKSSPGILEKVMSEMGFEFEPPKIREAHIKMKWVFENPPIDSVEYWKKILQLQYGVKTILSIFSEPHGANMTLPYKVETLGMLQWGPEKQPFHTTYFPLTGTQVDYITLKLLRLLDGLPSHAIRLCPGCEKYFFNPSLRDKNFCSPRCMWRINAEQRRKDLKEKHPKKYKAYLKKQKEIMRQKYLKKQNARGYKKIGPYKRKD